MREKEIIQNLKKLRKIRPERDWVKKTKIEIVGESFPVFYFKTILMGIFILLVSIGFVKAEGALPGEPLYLIKRGMEKIQTVFLKKEKKPEIVLESVEKRVEELSQVVEKNQPKKLASAIKEVKKESFEAAKVLKESKIEKEKLSNVWTTLRKIGDVEKKLEIEIPVSEYENAISQKIEIIIQDLEKSNLTPAQKKILEKAKEDLKNGDLESALTKVLLISKVEDWSQSSK